MRLAIEQAPTTAFAVARPVVAVGRDRYPLCAFSHQVQIGCWHWAPRGSPRACSRPRADCPPRPPDSCGGGDDAEEEGAAGGSVHGGGRRPGVMRASWWRCWLRGGERAKEGESQPRAEDRTVPIAIAFFPLSLPLHCILPVVCIFKISGLHPLPTNEVSPFLNGISGDRSLWCNAQT